MPGVVVTKGRAYLTNLEFLAFTFGLFNPSRPEGFQKFCGNKINEDFYSYTSLWYLKKVLQLLQSS